MMWGSLNPNSQQMVAPGMPNAMGGPLGGNNMALLQMLMARRNSPMARMAGAAAPGGAMPLPGGETVNMAAPPMPGGGTSIAGAPMPFVPDTGGAGDTSIAGAPMTPTPDAAPGQSMTLGGQPGLINRMLGMPQGVGMLNNIFGNMGMGSGQPNPANMTPKIPAFNSNAPGPNALTGMW
mgnify:CR=1 FL=1